MSDAKELRADVVGRYRYLSHESLLRHADYTCSDVGPPSVRGADDALAFDVVDGLPRLYARYTCRDGLVFKDRVRQFMYCSNRRWIGVLPSCILGRLRRLKTVHSSRIPRHMITHESENVCGL